MSLSSIHGWHEMSLPKIADILNIQTPTILFWFKSSHNKGETSHTGVAVCPKQRSGCNFGFCCYPSEVFNTYPSGPHNIVQTAAQRCNCNLCSFSIQVSHHHYWSHNGARCLEPSSGCSWFFFFFFFLNFIQGLEVKLLIVCLSVSFPVFWASNS